MSTVHAKNDSEREQTIVLALGRLLRLGSRPFRPGDGEEYERCRAIVLVASAPPEPPPCETCQGTGHFCGYHGTEPCSCAADCVDCYGR